MTTSPIVPLLARLAVRLQQPESDRDAGSASAPTESVKTTRITEVKHETTDDN